MPRSIRGNTPARAPLLTTPQAPTTTGNVPWRTYEKSRSHCPMCGMMTDTSRFDSGPYWFDMYIQRYGGSYPGYKQKGKRAVRNGYIEYFEDNGDVDNMIRELITYSKHVTQSLQARLGEAEPIETYIAGPSPNEYQEFEETAGQPEQLPEFEEDFEENQLPPSRVSKEAHKIEKQQKRQGRPLRSAPQAKQLPQSSQHTARQIQPTQPVRQPLTGRTHEVRQLTPAQRRRQIESQKRPQLGPGSPKLPPGRK